MKKMNITLVLILVVSVLMTACQPAVPPETPPVDEPPIGDDYAYGEDAVVETLEILLMESFPLQARAVVSGYLPDGCTELVEVNVTQQGNAFVITLVTRRPTGDVVCTMALEFFEESIALDIEGLDAGTYSVIAQDQQAQFTLDVDNVLSGEPVESIKPILGGGDTVLTSDAVLENLSVMVMESDPVQVRVALSGYLPDGCTTIREIRSSREGEVFTIEIITQRPGGDVACTMAIVPFEKQIDLDVEGLPAGEYMVHCGELSETFTLEMDN